ncbi:porin [Labrys okinawensis]|uniref:porin n=1 Tax=Labrys okinawensis TaxID=346911 RepID=UPI0039BC542A
MFRSVLLGAAAALAGVGVAYAADLPMEKGEAVEYVKVCSTFGPGFFYIPGSDTCLKIGGEIRADYRAFGGDSGYRVNGGTTISGAGFNRNDDRSAFNTQARIWFDARTQTDYGLLRSYFQIDADSHPISAQGRGGTYNGNTFTVDKAFIQFGGLTAGYAHSFFGFYDNEYGDTIWAPYYAETNTTNLVAYTAQFGSGFSATLSVEDGRDHRVNSPLGTAYTSLSAGVSGITIGSVQGGQQVPDVVGQLRFDQSWGSLAVQGALHENRTAATWTLTAGGATASINLPSDTKWGYAIGGTALIKLPFVDGGHFIVEGQYADGAADYLGANNTFFGTSPADLYPVTPTIIGGLGAIGRFDTDKGWSVVAELGGNITPVLNANLVGSYIGMKSDNWLGIASYQIKEYSIAGNLTYTIVKGLTAGAEVAYTHGEWDLNDGPVKFSPTVSAWQAGIRLKRTF